MAVTRIHTLSHDCSHLIGLPRFRVVRRKPGKSYQTALPSPAIFYAHECHPRGKIRLACETTVIFIMNGNSDWLHRQFSILLIDEMKYKENLVFYKHTGIEIQDHYTSVIYYDSCSWNEQGNCTQGNPYKLNRPFTMRTSIELANEMLM